MGSRSTTETSDTAKTAKASVSFQDKVLEEIAREEVPSGKASMAALAAILQCTGRFSLAEKGREKLSIRTNRRTVATKCFTLLEKTLNITCVSVLSEDTSWDPSGHSSSAHCVYELSGEPVRRVTAALYYDLKEDESERGLRAISEKLLTDRRCVRAFLAHQFLCIGTIRDPQKEYYLSYDILSDEQAEQTLSLLAGEGLALRIVQHRKSRAIVTRDSDVIVDVLNLVGAHVSMMDMENARIVKQVRGRVNRNVNCETANILKTVAASQRQIEEIRLIRQSSAWEALPDSLRQVALLREQFPESSLQELGDMLDPPVGKSGVNHRLRRLSAIAQELQQENGSERMGTVKGDRAAESLFGGERYYDQEVDDDCTERWTGSPSNCGAGSGGEQI